MPVRSPQRKDDKPRPLTRLETLRALRISTMAEMGSSTHFNLTNGAFQTGFALWLGANNFWMGVLAAIPALVSPIQMISSYWVDRSGRRKPITAWAFGLGRILWLPILLIPFLLPLSGRFWAFLILFTLSSILLSLPIPAFVSWLGDLVPADHRGRYFGRRNTLAGATGMGLSLIAAWFLDLASKQHLFSQAIGFGAIFGVAVAAALFAWHCFSIQPEPPMIRPDGETSGPLLSRLRDFYQAPLRDRRFRYFILFGCLFAFGQNVAAPFFTVYSLNVLQLNYVWLQIVNTIAGVTSLLSLPLWGYLSDKFGNKPIIAISSFGVAVLPLGWVVTSRSHLGFSILMISIVNIAGGMFWAGAGQTQFNLLIAASPSDRRPVYVAAIAAITGLVGGVAPILGGIFLDMLRSVTVHLAGLEMGRYQLLFILTTLARFLVFIPLKKVEDQEAATTRAVLTQLGSSSVTDIRYLRRLQKAESRIERGKAAEALGTARAALAVDDLIRALRDPDRKVREQASRALGEIGERRAVPSLLEAVVDPASGIVEAAAEALGHLRAKEAVEPLVHLLDNGSSIEKIIAARSLGRINEPSSYGAMERAFLKLDQPLSVQSAIVRAWSDIQNPLHIPPMLIRLPDSSSDLRAEILRAIAHIGSDEETVNGLLKMASTAETEDWLLPDYADVVAASKDVRNAVAVLEWIGRTDSASAKRRILFSAGRILMLEEITYPLLNSEGVTRDVEVGRIFENIRRELKGRGGRIDSLRRVDLLDRAQEAYAQGEMASALQLFDQLLQTAGIWVDDGVSVYREVFSRLIAVAHECPDAFMLGLSLLRAALRSGAIKS